MTAHEWGTAPEFVGPRHELRERLLLDLFLSAAPGQRVLDAGAGQGSMSARLDRLGFEVTSADASEAAVDVLRSRLRGDVVRASVTDLPFPDASFDAAVLGEVLEHVEDDRAALDEVARVVRPGGAIVLSVPADPELFGPSDEWAGHFRRYSRDALLDVCAAAGLVVERCSAWGFPLSRLYHRHVYERYLDRHGPSRPGGRHRPLVGLLGALLQIDRLFVGVERGALGYLLLATRP
ncbi:MAG TPA: class I SAM-dependent methyltransferase [Gaiellaceae bacterium]|nr:class I SAM-dependent methyltransferase [Gaiellaceae bacterium]